MHECYPRRGFDTVDRMTAVGTVNPYKQRLRTIIEPLLLARRIYRQADPESELFRKNLEIKSALDERLRKTKAAIRQEVLTSSDPADDLASHGYGEL